MSIVDISQPSSLGILTFLILLIYVLIISIMIYGLILFIKLAHRGIKALDIYINQNAQK